MAIPRAICSSCSRWGSACSRQTNNFSNSVGIWTTGARTTTNVRFCLPATICRASACTISADCRKRWKFCSTNKALPSDEASASSALIAASGSWPPASLAPFWPATRKPWSMSQVAKCQTSSRQSWPISAKASSCSWDSIQIPVKHARTYSLSRLFSTGVLHGF